MTSTTVPPHVLTATWSRCGSCPDGGPCADCAEDRELDFTLTCPGVDVAGCTAYQECRLCERGEVLPDGVATVDERDELDDYEAHGREHMRIGGMWMEKLLPPRCFAVIGDYIDAARDLVSMPGSYLVQPDSDADIGMLELEFDLAEPTRPCHKYLPRSGPGAGAPPSRCVHKGPHEEHKRADGTTWTGL